VHDTGIGIPKEEREKIFDSFYEIGSINTHKSGTYEFMSKGLGLGLSIAKKFALANGGSIHVESEENKGSSFIIRFQL
jgi:signal transduction histidine kinase